jgi:hypothetical protein
VPQDFAYDFTFGGEDFQDVVLTWEFDRRRYASKDGSSRKSRLPDPSGRDQGIGWAVAVSDVLRMLDRVRSGHASVDEVRDMLLALTQEPSKKSGCCPDCENAIDDYASAVAQVERARARFDDPITYPYLVTQSAIHTWDCHHFAGQLPAGAGSSVSDYVHNVGRFRSEHGLTRLTAEEAARWISARIGPQGGQRWRRCRVCQPALPGAWESEANDVPNTAGPVRG